MLLFLMIYAQLKNFEVRVNWIVVVYRLNIFFNWDEATFIILLVLFIILGRAFWEFMNLWLSRPRSYKTIFLKNKRTFVRFLIYSASWELLRTDIFN